MPTPFFPAWRPRLAALGQRVQRLRAQSLSHLEELFGRFLPAGLLAQADEGPNSRERIYSLRRVFWGFLYQVLNPQCPCREVVRQFQAFFRLHNLGPVDERTGGYCTARLRFPLDTLQRLRHAVAAHAQRVLPVAEQLWYGLTPKVIDGTTVTLPDTPKNQRAYPQSRSQKPGCGFPLMRVVGIFSLASGALLDYAKGNKHQHELTLLHPLLDHFKPRDLAQAAAQTPLSAQHRMETHSQRTDGARVAVSTPGAGLSSRIGHPGHDLVGSQDVSGPRTGSPLCAPLADRAVVS